MRRYAVAGRVYNLGLILVCLLTMLVLASCEIGTSDTSPTPTEGIIVVTPSSIPSPLEPTQAPPTPQPSLTPEGYPAPATPEPTLTPEAYPAS